MAALMLAAIVQVQHVVHLHHNGKRLMASMTDQGSVTKEKK
jgi:hypothetical protein